MGARGKAFDVHVERRRAIMVALEGIVWMCAGGACADGVAGCQPLLSPPSGGVATALSDGFPFLVSQTVLNRAFRLDLSACRFGTGQSRTRFSAVPLDSRNGNQPRPERSESRETESPAPAAAPAPAPVPTSSSEPDAAPKPVVEIEAEPETEEAPPPDTGDNRFFPL
ncbi:hypothetical protein R3X27_14795 [Tropicimonas sp. TH_r6]|uniref:hypothetical protein n=1 Tax=Tropicimonas sp. TH_r6 TaxID=3082085 RepID=UPI002955D9AB|nr:hypothetical protein [Tropicimonas sp. TH_r6]MDV7143953.1 hypothetical protein [Tropicimonas sp. TH_r6]